MQVTLTNSVKQPNSVNPIICEILQHMFGAVEAAGTHLTRTPFLIQSICSHFLQLPNVPPGRSSV